MRNGVAFVIVGFVAAGGAFACSSSSSSEPTGKALGASCTQDSECASTTRGEVACFIGGGGDGGGSGEGGGGGGGSDGGAKTWCSVKCANPGKPDPVCSAPFDGNCNAKGYCRLN